MNCHPERSAMGFGVVDMMTNHAGRVDRLGCIEDGKVQPLATGQCIPVKELVTLVQRHAALNIPAV